MRPAPVGYDPPPRRAASADHRVSARTSADNQSCTVSANTTQFALKMQDGKTVKFDDVGNLRAQESFKAHKKWSDYRHLPANPFA